MLPPSVLQQLADQFYRESSSASMEIDANPETLQQPTMGSPFLFRLQNLNKPEAPSTCCGVLEFIAEEGRVYLPEWMMKYLKVRGGEFLRVEGLSQIIPCGTKVIIQPQSMAFIENISDPRAVLERSFRAFSTLTRGDKITIEYIGDEYDILVVDVEPNDSVQGATGSNTEYPPTICITETDLVVDFSAPPGYVDPVADTGKNQSKRSIVGSIFEDCSKQATKSKQFVPFQGKENRLREPKKNASESSSPSSTSTEPIKVFAVKFPPNKLYIPPLAVKVNKPDL